MKKLIQILTIALVSASLFACESLKLGDAGLSRAPETSGATVDTLFATIKDADKVLASAYYYLHYGLVTEFDNLMSKDVVEAITDHYSSARFSEGNGPNELYYSGALTPSANSTSSQAYCFGKEKDYHVIRYAWLFLENADRIPDADPAELAKKKAEAKLCMAIAYANMVRYIGGVPILDHAVVPSENMYYPRNTFAETIQYIVDLCDQAAPDLPWSVSKNDDGRLTRAAALGRLAASRELVKAVIGEPRRGILVERLRAGLCGVEPGGVEHEPVARLLVSGAVVVPVLGINEHGRSPLNVERALQFGVGVVGRREERHDVGLVAPEVLPKRGVHVVTDVVAGVDVACEILLGFSVAHVIAAPDRGAHGG